MESSDLLKMSRSFWISGSTGSLGAWEVVVDGCGGVDWGVCEEEEVGDGWSVGGLEGGDVQSQPIVKLFAARYMWMKMD